jgi:hypothetical protein
VDAAQELLALSPPANLLQHLHAHSARVPHLLGEDVKRHYFFLCLHMSSYTPECYCGNAAVSRVCGPNSKPENVGRKFWCCAVRKEDGGCDFWLLGNRVPASGGGNNNRQQAARYAGASANTQRRVVAQQHAKPKSASGNVVAVLQRLHERITALELELAKPAEPRKRQRNDAAAAAAAADDQQQPDEADLLDDDEMLAILAA